MRRGFGTICLVLGTSTVPARAQVFTSEFFSDPVSEGWEPIQQYCEPELWNKQGLYYQQLDLDACPDSVPGGGRDVYRRSLESFNGTANFFAEFRVRTNSDRSEIPGGAPALVAMSNDAGVLYHITVSRDLVQFFRDVDLPIWFIDIKADVPHTYRIELYANRYAFYVDAELIDQGIAEGAFPAYQSKLIWQGRSWYFPCLNSWDYIRYGVIPADGSGDFDSDAATTLTDFYFVRECLTNERPGILGGPDNDSGPGCRFADFDADSDVDLLDFAEFQNGFAGND